MCYSVQPKDWIFVKGSGFLSFVKNMCKNICKNISNKLSGNYGPSILAMRPKFLDHAKQSAEDTFKAALKREFKKAAETTADLIGNKSANW